MCTVTFIARQKGYCLGMNRDEKLTRPTGLPPNKRNVNGRAVLCPSEPGGGTWIALDDGGTTFALINWYSITARVLGKAVSRGEVVNSVSTASTPDFADAALAEKFYRALAARLARRNPMKSIAAISGDGSCE